MKSFEPPNLEMVCLSKMAYLCFPHLQVRIIPQIKYPFRLGELKKSVDTAIDDYENIVLIGDMM